MASLLLIEPQLAGHYMRYVAWISREAARRGYEVWLAAPGSFFDHPLYREIERGCDGLMTPIPLEERRREPFKGGRGYQFHCHRMFARLYRRLKKQGAAPDYVMVPCLDYCSHAAGLLGSPFEDTPWGGILINPDFHLREMGVEIPRNRKRGIKERLFSRLLAIETLRVAFTLDELLLEYSRRKQSPELAGKVRLLPEPVELAGGGSREEARRRLSLKPAQTVILVYGVIDHSKGLDRLLESIRREDFPEDAALLVAGPQDTETKEMLSSPLANGLREAGRLRERDKFLHGPEEHNVFLASDIVWVGYKSQYISSGVLLQAGMASLPVVACNEGLIGWLSKNYNLGLAVEPDDPREVAAAISRLTRNKSLAAKLGANGRDHSRSHTDERFTRKLGEELAEWFPATKPPIAP